MWSVKSQILISDEPHAGSNPIFYALKRRKPAIKAGFLDVVSEETFFEHQANPRLFESLDYRMQKRLCISAEPSSKCGR